MSLRAVLFDLGDTLLDNHLFFLHFEELMTLWPMQVAQQMAADGYNLELEPVAGMLLATMERLAPLGEINGHPCAPHMPGCVERTGAHDLRGGCRCLPGDFLRRVRFLHRTRPPVLQRDVL